MANPILKQIDDLARNYADLFEKIGAPKSTVEKIRSGELPMDQASRMQRAIEQGYDPKVTYHHGRKGIIEFQIPTDGRNYKYGPAVYSSPKRGYGEPYLRANKISDEDAKIYELMSRGKIASTDKVSDQHFDARNMAFDIADQEGRDSNPNDYWRAMHQILQDKGYTGLDIMKERAVFDPANVRYKGAAFDPDQVGNPNIFASAAPVAAGGVLAALGMAPQEAEAGFFPYAFKMAEDALDRGSSLFTEKALKSAASDADGNSRTAITMMSPDEFLRVVPTPENSISQANIDKIAEHIRSGGKLDDVPFLTVGMDKDMNMPRYTGHEGRHRALALKKLGINEMPVRIKMGDDMGVRWDQLHSKNPLRNSSLPDFVLHQEGLTSSQFPIKKTRTGFETARGVAATGGILGALGLPEDATAADIATAGMKIAPKEEAQGEMQQMILDALLGFMAPTPMGDATMDAYNRNRIR